MARGAQTLLLATENLGGEFVVRVSTPPRPQWDRTASSPRSPTEFIASNEQVVLAQPFSNISNLLVVNDELQFPQVTALVGVVAATLVPLASRAQRLN